MSKLEIDKESLFRTIMIGSVSAIVLGAVLALVLIACI